MAEKYRLRFVLIEGDDGWSAHCLEHDIATQAATLSELYYQIERTLAGHLQISARNGTAPFAELPRAPKKFWDMFRRSHLKLEPPRRIKIKTRNRVTAVAPPELRVAELA
jgi:hypothetical protein